MTDYTETLAALGKETAGRVVRAFDLWAAGAIDDDLFAELVGDALFLADIKATSLADVALAAWLTVRWGRPVPTLGMAPPSLDHLPRIRDLIGQGAPREQWESYGRSSALSTAQDVYGDAMRQRGVTRWTRKLDAGACQLCRDLAGETLPSSAPMYHHDGCGCTQQPVTTE